MLCEKCGWGFAKKGKLCSRCEADRKAGQREVKYSKRKTLPVLK